MKKDPKKVVQELLNQIGNVDNLLSYTNCMTRLRLKFKEPYLIDLEKIKQIDNVLGVVVNGDEYQIILGPGFVEKVRKELDQIIKDRENSVETKVQQSKSSDLSEIAKINKGERKDKNKSPIQQFLAKFAKIFTPLIFAFIGAGILAGVAGLLQSFGSEVIFDPITEQDQIIWNNKTIESFYNFFNLLLVLWKDAFIVIVGWRTAKVFGGTGATGALLSCLFVPSFAGVVTSPFIAEQENGLIVGFNFLGIPINNPGTNWLTIGFRPEYSDGIGWSLSYASGSIIGAMFLAGLSIPIEKQLRKIVPDTFDIILTSTLSFLILLFAAYFLVIPLSGILFILISKLFSALYLNPFGAAFLAGIFLLAVVFGVHQGFIPIYLIALENTGVNGLFPILAMAGAGQVGVAIALYFKTPKDSNLRPQIKGAIIPGIFGIGEPLIYGVTLPRPKTFVAAMLGGAMGGFFLGAMSSWAGIQVGLVSMFGPSGILAILMMTTPNGNVLIAMAIYLVALLIAYSSGFIFMELIGVKGVDLN